MKSVIGISSVSTRRRSRYRKSIVEFGKPLKKQSCSEFDSLHITFSKNPMQIRTFSKNYCSDSRGRFIRFERKATLLKLGTDARWTDANKVGGRDVVSVTVPELGIKQGRQYPVLHSTMLPSDWKSIRDKQNLSLVSNLFIKLGNRCLKICNQLVKGIQIQPNHIIHIFHFHLACQTPRMC